MDIGAPLVGEVVIPAAPPSHAFGETSRAKRPSLVMPFARAAGRRRRGGGSTGDRRAVLEEAGYKRPSKAAIIERAPPRGNREKHMKTVTVSGGAAAARRSPPSPQTVEESPTVEESDETSKETSEQQNARETAESYLQTGAFSRKSLIEQLKFEAFRAQTRCTRWTRSAPTGTAGGQERRVVPRDQFVLAIKSDRAAQIRGLHGRAGRVRRAESVLRRVRRASKDLY